MIYNIYYFARRELGSRKFMCMNFWLIFYRAYWGRGALRGTKPTSLSLNHPYHVYKFCPWPSRRAFESVFRWISKTPYMIAGWSAMVAANDT